MSYFKNNIKIIEKSVESIDLNVFEKLLIDSVDAIRRGNKIIASGLGKNVPICEKFEGTMLSLGLPAFFMHTNSAIHGDLGAVKKGDVVIVLTKSGSTEESVNLVQCLGDRDAVVWLLTFSEEGYLSQNMKNVLCLKLEHEGDLWNIVPNNSTTVNLIVLQTLAIEIAKKLNLTIKDFKCNHPGGHIGELLKEV